MTVPGDLLRRARWADIVSVMTTNENDTSRHVALLIEWNTELALDDDPNPKESAKAYVRTTLDNGWLSKDDDAPVWELVELLGYDRNNMDGLAVYHQIASLIDSYDLNN